MRKQFNLGPPLPDGLILTAAPARRTTFCQCNHAANVEVDPRPGSSRDPAVRCGPRLRSGDQPHDCGGQVRDAQVLESLFTNEWCIRLRAKSAFKSRLWISHLSQTYRMEGSIVVDLHIETCLPNPLASKAPGPA